ncbi:MAG: hypothetical protein ACE5IY_10980 [bacterium]
MAKILLSRLIFVLFFLAMLISNAPAQNFLFKQPRRGGFKFKQHDEFDFTNAQHFTGSGILAVGFYRLLQHTHIRKPKVMASLLATGVGLLKELEDGYREGWGMKDVLFNELGIMTFLILNEYTRFTLTLKQVIISPDDYGAGIRFFRSADLTPLNASFGVYLIHTNNRETWVGLDSHFSLIEKLEFHVGSSMINLGYANRFHFRPNVGFGIRLL